LDFASIFTSLTEDVPRVFDIGAAGSVSKGHITADYRDCG
jgi:hypothetical protein